ncbi:MAG: phage major tail tube protein [Desulfobacteraceae bacterium]|nr:phage major tail tube protein [Desulfobacteraceae bacterium]
MSANQVPERLINFRVYNEDNALVGVADVQLPALEAMTETVKGAGIAGEIDSPTIGHYGSMTVSINFRTVTAAMVSLAAPKAHYLAFQGSIQVYDSAEGKYTTKALKVAVKATPKKTEFGKMDVGAAQESSWEGEVSYLKITLADDEVLELDKFNFICKIDGEDYLETLRSDMGIS